MKLKYLFGVGIVISLMTIIYACGEGTPKLDASPIWKTHCQLCHGADGKLGLNGAKDLSASPLTVDERIQVITNGRNTMLSYANTLTKEEIAAVAKYTTTFK